LEEKGRRETWPETVDRYISFFSERNPEVADEIKETTSYIRDLRVMPSMRALMTAGPALKRDEVAGYNCAFLTVDHPRAFDETMYILMCGTGVGFSVERQYVSKLPEVAEEFHESDSVINVKDSRIGWAASLRELISLLYNGQIPKWNLDKIRPAGSRLKTFGGRASGPEPLNDLFKFCVVLFSRAAGRKLSSIECHDLVCKIAEIVVVGGVRRSALLSLSNVSDDRMRRAKSGQWFPDQKQRQLANNSACYTERPDFSVFLAEWTSLYESKRGERGVFSRVAAQRQVAKNGRRDTNYDFGTNPCSEIILRPDQFCNLSEVVVRSSDSIEDLMEKVRIAAILGTLQSTLTKFRYLRRVWGKNTREERLLGVSLTGIMDHPVLGDADNPELPSILEKLGEHAVETNRIWAEKLGIPQSTAVTCVKPSGTVSQLVNSSSGIHPRFSPFYIRRVRIDKKQPLADFMVERGFPHEDDVGNPGTLVFEFPVKSPENSVVVKDVDAIQQLKLWTIYQDHWCEHKPSCTVYYRDENFMHVGAWIWDNFDKVSGVSFLPQSDHVYPQAPYEEITEEEFIRRTSEMPIVDWGELEAYENTDNTVGSHTLACSGGHCEVVDLVQAS
jgi:ribonucleoside-diphosphate reductase alpha chain